MKKINLTTVKMTADCEVIGLSASFVAAAVRAADVAEDFGDRIKAHCPIRQKLNEEGEPYDENGKPLEVEYNWADAVMPSVNGFAVQDLYEKVVLFLVELRNAMLGEERV